MKPVLYKNSSNQRLAKQRVPWLTLGVIFLAVYAVVLLTTLASAVRASRIYPAEALKYQ